MSTMTEAPKRAVRQKKHELDSRQFPINQRDPIKMPGLGQELDHPSNIVIAEGPLPMQQLEELAFMEEPVKILIHRGSDKLSMRVTDYIAINGIAGEILYKNGWIPVGYFPRGQSFYTKRKYVGVLARAKKDNITTNVIQRDGEDPENFTEVATQSILSFVVLEDKNPRGAEWLEALIRMNS